MFQPTRSILVTLSVLALAAASCDRPFDAAGDTLDQPSESPVTTTTTPDFSDQASPGGAATETAAPLASAGFIEISGGEGGFVADLGTDDRFGRDHDQIGDVDGDGVTDLVAGARSDDDGPSGADELTDAGAVYILFMNEDGTVRSNQKISSLTGDFSMPLTEGSFFGYGVAGIGDYDGDGIPDIAASAPGSRNSTGFEPSIFILHLNADGTVKSTVTTTGIVGMGLSAIGDLDGDGRVDLVAASPDAGTAGQIRILFFDENSELRTDETVTIGPGEGGFEEELNAGDGFGGRESALLGDLDGDGSPELAVGSFMSDGGAGAIWILSLDSQTHQVIEAEKLAPGVNGFDETLAMAENENGTSGAHFGHALVAAGDLDGDDVPDLITSANQYEAGVGYVIYLNPDKTVKGFYRITNDEGGFDLSLPDDDRFGRSMSIVDGDRDQGSITVNFGGGAANRKGGAIYSLTLLVE